MPFLFQTLIKLPLPLISYFTNGAPTSLLFSTNGAGNPRSRPASPADTLTSASHIRSGRRPFPTSPSRPRTAHPLPVAAAAPPHRRSHTPPLPVAHAPLPVAHAALPIAHAPLPVAHAAPLPVEHAAPPRRPLPPPSSKAKAFDEELMTGGGLNRSASAAFKNALPPQELLDDLCSRFVLNVPKEDQQSFERILFLVEYAHWFYEDNTVEKNPSLKSLTLKEFTTLLFNNCDVLKPYVPHLDDIFKDFTSYKVRVPVTGAIILDETYERCLLVKGWKGTSWSFPRGKKNKDEEDHNCAIREVLEETGFDVSGLLNKDDYIEMIFGQQRVRLYIVAGVKEDTFFAPLTKKEISEIAWQRIDELQHANADVISRGINGLKLYMVAPFLGSLKSWISMHPPRVTPRPDRPTRVVTVWKAKTSSSGGSSTAAESQSSKTVGDVVEARPSRSFRNFRFDTAPILQAVEAAFST